MRSRRGFGSSIVARPWLLVFLPVNAASSAFSVALPLLILFTLHAGVLQVSLAATFYSMALVPASLLWGAICDRWKVRAPLLLLNSVAFAAVFVVLAALPSLAVLLAVYTLYGFIAPSSAAASNLLILERFSADERPTAYASFSELSILGGVSGILIGFAWTARFGGGSGLLGLLYIAAALSAASAVGVALFVRDAPRKHSRLSLLHLPEALAARLHSFIPFFPHLPARPFLPRAARWLREEATHEVPLMLVGGFLFNLGSNLFNTSYTPYLASSAVGIGTSGIFLVNLSNNAAQAVVYPSSGRASQGGAAGSVVGISLWARGAGYGLVALFAFVPLAIWAGSSGLVTNLIVFAVVGMSYAYFSTSSSLLLFRSFEGRSAGSLLGANSAIAGVAAVLGAAGSGVVSHLLGFGATFLLAAIGMAAAVPVWAASGRAYRRRHRPMGS
jgi:MFS family permease